MKLNQEALVCLNRSVRSNRLKFAAVLGTEILGLRYLMVRFDPVTACNLRSGMCYFSDPNWSARYSGSRFAAEDIDRVGVYCNRAFFKRAPRSAERGVSVKVCASRCSVIGTSTPAWPSDQMRR
jgi:hypothetical protein